MNLHRTFLISAVLAAFAMKAPAGIVYEHGLTDPGCNYVNSDLADWDHVDIVVIPGAATGDYTFRRSTGAYGYSVRVLDSDGHFAVVGGSVFEGAYANNGDFNSNWRLIGGPSGTPTVITGEVMHSGGIICDTTYGHGFHNVTVHGAVAITIGDATSPDDNSHKCRDETVGGDMCSTCKGMARYTANSTTVSLRVSDTPLSYTPPRGPTIDLTLTYNQRDSDQSPAQAYSNFGPNWTWSWVSYVTDNPTASDNDYTDNALFNARVYIPGGGTETYKNYDRDTHDYPADPQSRAGLVRTTESPISYEKRFPDGSKQVFTHSDNSSIFPRHVFMTQKIDPAGNAVTINYDSSHRVTSIVDAVGQTTALAYELQGDSLKVTKVTDPFGRFALFDYYTNGQLKSITDPIGIVSQFTYETGNNFINALTTPYGTATFASGSDATGTNRWLNMTDPRGAVERLEYRYFTDPDVISPTDPTGTVPSGSEFVNSNLNLRNTYYWDKKAMAEPGAPDYTQAKITHWLRSYDGARISGIVASEKMPLENRVWRIYPQQPDYSRIGPVAQAAQIARVLDDGSTQRWRHEYNSFGNVTKTTDPVGRVFTNVYATNGIDVIEKRQTRGSNNELLRSTTYNSLHEPLVDTDAAGQPTTYVYRSDGHGQLQSVQNAKGETTSYSYGPATDVPADYLASITSPAFNGASTSTSFTYDAAHRIHTVTNNPDDYTVTTDYDDLDRPTQITFPNGKTHEFGYTDDERGMTLDLTASKDRLDRWTYRHYNSNRQMDSITDPEDRTTLYGWCTCGSLTSITDPNLNVTTFNRDLQSRVTSKVFADGAPNSTTVNYTYEDTTSRLKSTTDASGQTTHYQYFADNDIEQVSYTNARNPTPAVTYTYDPNYNRVASMITTGIGTTNYSYYPITSPPTVNANKLESVSGLFPNDTITYAYDQLGRVLSQNINGTTASVTYDSLGRLGTNTNPLGSFTRDYDGVTPRLQTLHYPSGQTANYIYFGNENDRHLETLQHLTSGSDNLSRHDYAYDNEGEITAWSKVLGFSASAIGFAYDNAGQLTGVSQGALEFQYGYDGAGNRLSDLFFGQYSQGGNTYTANNLNQLDSVTKDPGVGPALGPFPLIYDANGNMTADAAHKSYEWDAANRLIAINYTDTGKPHRIWL